jgi:hypothetical protein
MKAFAASQGKSYNDLETQVAFIKHEMQVDGPGTGYAMSKLNSAQTAEAAARAFVHYEKPAGYSKIGNQPGRDGSKNVKTMDARISAAKTFEQRFAGQQKPAELPKQAGS